MNNTPTISPAEQAGGWAWYGFQYLFLPGLLISLAKALSLSDGQMNFLYYFLNFAFVCLIFRRFLAESLRFAGAHMGRFLGWTAAGFCVLEAASWALGLLIGHFLPEFANVNDGAVAAMAADTPVLMFLGTVVLVPPAEELLFRGLIFGRLAEKNRALAYALSMLAFCAIHVMGYVGSYPAATIAVCFAQYLPAGLILCRSFEKSGTILTPILIHTAVNATAMILL